MNKQVLCLLFLAVLLWFMAISVASSKQPHTPSGVAVGQNGPDSIPGVVVVHDGPEDIPGVAVGQNGSDAIPTQPAGPAGQPGASFVEYSNPGEKDQASAVLQKFFPIVPDYPLPLSFQPNTLKDMRPAHPGAGINLIEAPRANNFGEARLRYLIEIPPGRNGMQPAISIQYNSSNGNGWLGIGWDISVSEITIDTRWGVPRYDAAKETETYLLDGEQLTPLAHRESLQDRIVEKVFHMRVEGQFHRIIRHGTQPNNYWWEVIHKNGTRYLYGGLPQGSGPDPETTLSDPLTGHIFRWMLSEVRDTWGNTITYAYGRVSDYGVTNGNVEGWQIYPREISYTGFAGQTGPYRVEFIRDRDLPDYAGQRRPDVIIDARSGFKMVTADLLRHIEVWYKNELVRWYDLEYQEGVFRKTLLKSISQLGPSDESFHKHEFEYFDDIRNNNGSYGAFETAKAWVTHNDNVNSDIPEGGQASAIGGESSTEGGGHLYVGYNSSSPTKQNSIGGKVGYTHSTTDGLLALMDIDGDSLPDKVFEDSGGYYFRRNLSTPTSLTPYQFGTKQQMPTLYVLSRETSDSMTFGVEGFPPGSDILLDYIHTFSTRSTYLTDVNGDGFPDLIDDGTVMFNCPNEQGIPTFFWDSFDTPVPIGQGAIDATDLIDDFTDIYEKRLDNFPLLDSVRRWIAPYDGQIRILGSAQLIEDTSQARQSYRTADGVWIAIQHNGAELWGERIEADDYLPHVPFGVDVIQVARGDRIYFRVQSVFDGAYDQVAWNPEIDYLNVPDDFQDANLLNPYHFSGSDDFVLAGRGGKTRMPFTGTVRVIGDLVKRGATSDDIALVVMKNGTPMITRSMTWDETGNILLQDDLNVAEQDELEFYVRVDSPIDVTMIDWVPEVFYIAADGVDSVTDPEGNYFIRFNPPYDVDLYPQHDSVTPQDPWVAPFTGTIKVIPQLMIPVFPPIDPFDGELVLTVKRSGELVAKRLITIQNGILPSPGDLKFTISVNEGDRIFFDYSTRDGPKHDDPQGLAGKLLTRRVGVVYRPPIIYRAIVPSDFHRSVLIPEAFPEPYRGWSFIAYNGNRERAEQPIDESLLFIDQDLFIDQYNNQQYRLDDMMVQLQIPYPAEGRWRASDELCWIARDAMSSSRLGMDNIEVPRPDQYAGHRAVPVMSSGDDFAAAISVGGVAGSIAIGTSRCELDYLDMNGDLFPDIVGKNRIQYTTLTGGLEPTNRFVPGLDPFRESDNWAANGGFGLGVGGNPAKSKQSARGDFSSSRSRSDSHSGRGKSASGKRRSSKGNKKGSSGKQGSDMPELGFDGQVGGGRAENTYDLIDINGDGLPDRVEGNGSTLEVALNLGYSFAPSEPWSSADLDDSESFGFNLGGSLGYNDRIYGFAGGASLTMNWNWPKGTLLDINGDGLVDYVTPDTNGFLVALNTGAGFDVPVLFAGGCNDRIGRDVTMEAGGGAYFTIGIGPLCLGGCYIIINPGGNVTFSMSRPETGFEDMNGDGYVDHIASDADDNLDVALNRTGRSNLLKKVMRPLGAILTLNYERNDPPNRWNLTSLKVFDGHAGDGADTMLSTYKYGGAVYHPNEREFYGYRTVIEEKRDSGNGHALYKTTTSTYNNDTYYNKGLLERKLVRDSAGNKFVKKVNTYLFIDIDTGAPLIYPESTTATVFPQLIGTETFFYEGLPTPGKVRHVTYRYDSIGNLVEFFNAGDTGAQDDLLVTVDYFTDLTNYIVNKPNSIIISGNGIELRRSEAIIETGTGAVRQVRRFLADGNVAVTDFDYDPKGNLNSVIGPPNLHGHRYTLIFDYDTQVQTHLAAVEDSFGYRSTCTYDLRFGRPDVLTDINRNQIDYDYDVFGRVWSVSGPYQVHGGLATISFEYHHDAFTPWALTRKIDVWRDVDDPIETATFSDGLGRILQTKEDAAVLIEDGNQPEDVMIVSGRLTFDSMGRIIERYYPITESLATAGAFNDTYDSIPPTRIQYDILNRVLQVTKPSGLFTTSMYGFGIDRENFPRFEAVVTDAKGIPKTIFRNVHGLITGVRETNRDETEVIWTSYVYDALGQLIEIEDHLHNKTHIVYDNFGRKTIINNPDTGETQRRYDLAGNVTEKTTANLDRYNESIQCDYEFNRLKSIAYPEFPENNVSYDYGGPQAPFNRAGRIVQITDQSGKEERYYGKLGEIIKEINTVASDTEGTSPNSPEVYTTEYTYDTWNRLLKLFYPDREDLTYFYDSGGRVLSTYGVKDNFQTEYIRYLWYDKFKQRVYLKMGNGVTTYSTYDPVFRCLTNLRTVNTYGTLFQNTYYEYDAVDNVIQTHNDVPVPPANQFGGPVLQNYCYDDFHRLIEATGSHEYAPRKVDQYQLTLSYNTIHNTIEKIQDHELIQPGGQPIGQKESSYSWWYVFGATQPHAPTHIGERTFTYDSNGNQTGWTHDSNGTRRAIVWDEENRIQSISDNGHTKSYKYNHVGRRVIKRGPQGETVYVNPYFTVRNRTIATKHIYAGSLRVASKMSPGYFNVRPPGGRPDTNFLYFYHPDHLGSSVYITSVDGGIFEHLEYFPFGEIWIEEKSNIQRTPYGFADKEFEEETELYYYGDRYYDPKIDVWQNPGEFERILNGQINGEVYNSGNLNLYAYRCQNPLKRIDDSWSIIDVSNYFSECNP